MPDMSNLSTFCSLSSTFSFILRRSLSSFCYSLNWCSLSLLYTMLSNCFSSVSGLRVKLIMLNLVAMSWVSFILAELLIMNNLNLGWTTSSAPLNWTYVLLLSGLTYMFLSTRLANAGSISQEESQMITTSPSTTARVTTLSYFSPEAVSNTNSLLTL